MVPKQKQLAISVGLLMLSIMSHAFWPAEAAAQLPPIANRLASAGQIANSEHWSFIPPRLRPLPEVKNSRWVRNPVDNFVLARLEKEGLQPSPEADRPTLIRRLSFDLTGLPPMTAEVEAFVKDKSTDAYERLVDRLLSSPHFGEQWGRHWLDMARYADSDGYEKDSVRPYAWLYRDWVIDAFNRDLPFDQFTLEQLAGDLLPDATHEQKVATGFHRNTLTNKEGGVDQEEDRCKKTVDRTSTTGTVWLGLTLGCAECHSHKYDPISQREFYQLYSFFNSVTEADLPAPKPAELEKYNREKNAWDEKAARLREQLVTSLPHDLPALQVDSLGKILGSPADKRTKEQSAELAKIFPDEDNPVRKELSLQFAALAKEEPKFPDTKAQTLAKFDKPRTNYIHIRGDFLRQGDEVHPATLSVLHDFKPRNGKADRLDLARWLVDPANSLTARVTVNRFWHHLFGRALVTTLDDFGTRGEKPSHPELLDWLAVTFMAPRNSQPSTLNPQPSCGWSQKAFIKLIVMSATYRQSSQYRSDLMERDSNNALLARQNRFRLDAENVRDASLAVSGLLNPSIGGPSIRPPLPADIAALGYANSIKWKESDAAQRHRRGLYIFFQRTVPYPMLMAFDAPDSNVACTRRERSNTPLQALTLLNDVVFFECAQALGNHLAQSSLPNSTAKLQQAFRVCFSREPTGKEFARLEKLYRDFIRLAQKDSENAAKIAGTANIDGNNVPEAATLAVVARTLMNLDEFVTRE